MKKRFFSLMLGLILIFSLVPAINLSAEGYIENWLNESHKDKFANNDFDGLDSFTINNPMNIENFDLNDPYADFSFWHFVDTSGKSKTASVTFLNDNQEEITFDNLVASSQAGGGQHYAVITPSGWKLLDGVSFSEASGNFNLSHSGRHERIAGKVSVIADVDKFYNEVTIDRYHERDVVEFYKRSVDEYYKRTVDEFYQRDVDEYYLRDVQEFYQRSVDAYYERPAQRFFVPVFAKKISAAYGTLVTRLTYDAKAKPTNGGAFNNGHTYVAINVAEASKEGGIWYTIADSSKNNGKKTPDEFNRPIDYQYNVQIKDGKMVITLDDRLIATSVGAYVVNNVKDFPGNAPKHFANKVTVDLPKNYKDTVYAYVHFEGAMWYTTGNYEFLEWRYRNTEFGEYKLIETVFGNYELVDTQYGEYELADTKYGNYELVNTQYGQYELVNTIYGQYELVDTQYGEYELVDTKINKTKVPVAYTGGLVLTVDGVVKPLNEVFFLDPGTYTFMLTGNGEFEPITKVVTIIAADNGVVDFGTIIIQLPDQTVAENDHYADRAADKDYADRETVKHFDDYDATKHYANREAKLHYNDRDAIKNYADKAPVNHYADNYNLLPDVYLGNETDPYNEHAIRIN